MPSHSGRANKQTDTERDEQRKCGFKKIMYTTEKAFVRVQLAMLPPDATCRPPIANIDCNVSKIPVASCPPTCASSCRTFVKIYHF